MPFVSSRLLTPRSFFCIQKGFILPARFVKEFNILNSY